MQATPRQLFTSVSLASLAAFSFAGAAAQAASTSYGFNILLDSGSLATQTYQGDLTYDNSSLQLLDFNFNFGGKTYTEADDPLAAVMTNGSTFLGLAYSVDGIPSFGFIPGTSALNEAYFVYDLNPTTSAPGSAGAGDITYTLQQAPPPVPGPLPLLGAAAAFRFSRRFRRLTPR